jgi:hypothetical protein
VVQPKVGGPSFTIPLRHGEVVVWSLSTNRRFTHKIVPAQVPDEWVGITMRTARTFVRFMDGQARLADGRPLVWVPPTDQRARAYFRLRGQENREFVFEWPAVDCTISPGDILRPV